MVVHPSELDFHIEVIHSNLFQNIILTPVEAKNKINALTLSSQTSSIFAISSVV